MLLADAAKPWTLLPVMLIAAARYSESDWEVVGLGCHREPAQLSELVDRRGPTKTPVAGVLSHRQTASALRRAQWGR